MMRKLFLAAALALATLGIACADPAPNAALHALFEREFQWQLKEFPEVATFAGVDTYNDRFADRSPAAVARRKTHAKALIIELQRFDARCLNAQDRISRALMLEKLRAADAVNALYGDLPFDGLGDWLVVAPTEGPQHTLLLDDDGPVPLSVLEARVDEWIANASARPDSAASARSGPAHLARSSPRSPASSRGTP